MFPPKVAKLYTEYIKELWIIIPIHLNISLIKIARRSEAQWL